MSSELFGSYLTSRLDGGKERCENGTSAALTYWPTGENRLGFLG